MKKSLFLLSLEQVIKDMPTSTARKPQGLHRGPGKRQMSEAERNKWLFMRKTQLMSIAEWDDPENFKHLPKPKKILGNEATSIVWPYALLLQNKLRVHPFTKSIYCYYFQYSFSKEGRDRNNLARKFSRESMVPITYHNSQCYVESEMILDYGEIPLLIVHCLDESSVVIPIVGHNTLKSGLSSVQKLRKTVSDNTVAAAKPSQSSHDYTKNHLVSDVERITEELGNSVTNPSVISRIFHDRPIQNAFLKINYQWFGETRQEREQHLVNYTWPWEGEEVQAPTIPNRNTRISMALNETPRGLPEKLNLKRGIKGIKYCNSQLDSKSRSFAQQVDNRAFSNGSRWGSPRRSGSS